MAPDPTKKIRLFVSATEASADLHGAHLLSEVKKEAGAAGLDVQFAGIGGARLESQGMQIWNRSSDLSVMGLGEVLAKIFKIRGILNLTASRLKEWNPDVAVFIDGPDFNLRLAKRVDLSTKSYYLIPPKVWVWREGRLRFLKRAFRKLFVILPFESAFYRDRGMAAEYLGNPLIDELPMKLSREDARKSLGIEAGAFVLCLMPGSRPSEISRHGVLFLEAASQFFQNATFALKQVLIPMLSDSEEWASRWAPAIERLKAQGVDIRFCSGAATALKAADLGMIKSGTSTLEAALMGCRHVVVYRVNWITELGYRILVRGLGGFRGPVSLVNLIAAWNPSDPGFFRTERAPRVFPEILLDQARPAVIAAELLRLHQDPERSGAQVLAMEKIARDVGSDQSPSRRIARAMLQDLKGGA